MEELWPIEQSQPPRKSFVFDGKDWIVFVLILTGYVQPRLPRNVAIMSVVSDVDLKSQSEIAWDGKLTWGQFGKGDLVRFAITTGSD